MTKRKKRIEFPIEARDEDVKPDHVEIFPDKVSLDKLRAIWNDKHIQYSDEQLHKMREWLYTISGVIIYVAEQQASGKPLVIPISSDHSEIAPNSIIPLSEYKKTA